MVSTCPIPHALQHMPAWVCTGLLCATQISHSHLRQHSTVSPPSSAAAGKPIWDPRVFTIIIIFFPFWWLSYNKLLYLSITSEHTQPWNVRPRRRNNTYDIYGKYPVLTPSLALHMGAALNFNPSANASFESRVFIETWKWVSKGCRSYLIHPGKPLVFPPL